MTDDRRVLDPVAWGDWVREHWLPETVDLRPWRSRCGHDCQGIRRPVVVPVRPDLSAEAREAIASRTATRAQLEAIQMLAFREGLSPRGQWTDHDEHELREIGPRAPRELTAAALHRTPAATARQARALDVELDAGWSGLYQVEGGRGGVRRLVHDEIVEVVLSRLGGPLAWSVADIARAAGVSGVGALKALRRLGAKPAIPRRARSAAGTFSRGNVALHAATFTVVDAWRVVVAVEEERRRRSADRPPCVSCGERPRTRDGVMCSRCSARERKRASRSQVG